MKARTNRRREYGECGQRTEALPGDEERKGGWVQQMWMKDKSTHKQETRERGR